MKPIPWWKHIVLFLGALFISAIPTGIFEVFNDRLGGDHIFDSIVAVVLLVIVWRWLLRRERAARGILTPIFDKDLKDLYQKGREGK